MYGDAMVKRVPMALAMALAWPRITVGMISTENWKTALEAMQMKNRPSIENITRTAWRERVIFDEKLIIRTVDSNHIF